MESKSTLNEQTIKQLQSLIRANIDAAEGFDECGGKLSDAKAANLMRDLGHERNQMKEELMSLVEFNAEEPVKEGSFAANVHRSWISVRSALSGNDLKPILAEVLRGEGHLESQYESSLKENPGSAVNDVLQRHHRQVVAAREKLEAFQESPAAT